MITQQDIYNAFYFSYGYAHPDETAASSLVINQLEIPQASINRSLGTLEHKTVFFRKKSCGSVWCQKCYRAKYAPEQAVRMSRMNWQKVRNITLTFDRDLVGQGQEAYIWYKKHQPLGRFIQNLGRAGYKVLDWTTNLEWHDDGTPHFHMLVELDRVGKIGKETIQDIWGLGHAWETYFKSEYHFKDYLGYFGKTGYLHKDKQHQIDLPAWANCDDWRGVKINRFSSMRHKNEDKRKETLTLEDIDQYREPEMQKSPRTYAEKLENCGLQTEVWTLDDSGHQELVRVLNIPYNDVLGCANGEFTPGLGYVLRYDQYCPPDQLLNDLIYLEKTGFVPF